METSPRVDFVRLRLVARVLELVELAVERRGVLAQQPGEHLTGFLEAIEPFFDAAEFDAICPGLFFVPPGADTQLEPAVGNDVQRRGHIGQHRGMAVVDSGDKRADPQPLGGLRQRGEGRPAFQTWARRVGEDRIEVIEGPARFEDVDVVGRLPDGQHVGPRGVLRGCLDCESHRVEPSRGRLVWSCERIAPII